MVSTAARSHIAATLVFVASVLLLYGKAPVWCLVIALAAATWRLLIAGGRLPAPRARFGARFLLGVITALLVIAVAISFQTLNGLAARVASIPQAERPRVYYGRDVNGLETGLAGSINMEVLEKVGATNVAAAAGTGGITKVSMEQVLS